MSRFIIIFTVLILIDLYSFQAFRAIFENFNPNTKKIIFITYWVFSAAALLSIILFFSLNPYLNRVTRTLMSSIAFLNYFSKIFLVVFLIIDDIFRLFRWLYSYASQLLRKEGTPISTNSEISRADFLVKTGLVVASIPFVGMSYGILSGAHDYRIRRKTIYLPNLPKSFDGIRIGQISDIHSGSFFNKRAVKGGVEMLLNEKPDVIFFTGDLVNNMADEVKDYIDVFAKVKAPLGVYSTLGNHDYGDYVQWPSKEAKIENIQNVVTAHKEMGWDILMNEHRFLQEGSDRIAILGVENWGMRGFGKYGKLSVAHKGTMEVPVKLLLSHDPSHWDGEILPQYKDIDVTFSGHTHGFQFGVELGNIKWSPVKYVYKQWAGLYENQNQYLYVNRGFGFIGFPGRVGMPPEITILELKKA